MKLDTITAQILAGCRADHQWYGQYMRRTTWRVGADVKVLEPYLSTTGSLLDIDGSTPVLSVVGSSREHNH